MYKYYLSHSFVNLWRRYNEVFEITSPNIYGPNFDQKMLEFNEPTGNSGGFGLYEVPIEKAVEWAVKNNNLYVLKAICEDIIREYNHDMLPCQ